MPIALHVFDDAEAVSLAVAEHLTALLAERPDAVLALPSGNTPVGVYARLATAVADGRVSFERASVFALDEYRGLGPDDPRSFAAFFAQHLFGPARVASGHVLDGLAADAGAECARYDAAIAACGGLDLTLLGLGANGHIAFNEPADALSAHTHVATLAEPARQVAPEGLTMGVGTLLSAPRVWLMATGAGKAEAVARLLSGRVDPHWPASLLQVHPGAEVFIDRSAAARL